jgi:hypothetical protein
MNTATAIEANVAYRQRLRRDELIADATRRRRCGT